MYILTDPRVYCTLFAVLFAALCTLPLYFSGIRRTYRFALSLSAAILTVSSLYAAYSNMLAGVDQADVLIAMLRLDLAKEREHILRATNVYPVSYSARMSVNMAAGGIADASPVEINKWRNDRLAGEQGDVQYYQNMMKESRANYRSHLIDPLGYQRF